MLWKLFQPRRSNAVLKAIGLVGVGVPLRAIGPLAIICPQTLPPLASQLTRVPFRSMTTSAREARRSAALTPRLSSH
jgi:hypothetical protein